MPIMPCDMWGGYEDSPSLSVPGQLLNGTPSVLHGLELYFHSSAPRVSWSSPRALSFRCLVKGCASDVVLLSSHDVPNPSPSPSHDDSLHAVLIAAGDRVAVGWRWCQAKRFARLS